MSELHDIDRRVAVLEEIARNTATALADIRAELRQQRQDTAAGFAALHGDMQALRSEMQALRREAREDFRFLMRVMIGGFGAVVAGFAAVLAVMAHGFHWL